MSCPAQEGGNGGGYVLWGVEKGKVRSGLGGRVSYQVLEEKNLIYHDKIPYS